ncbi:MAG TPA: MarR family winged helix-turn-helix transcriptional regulator [Nitrososphaeraceae archaeon]
MKTSSVTSQKMVEDSCTCGKLREAARAVTLLYDNAFKSSGLLSTQLGALHVIHDSTSITISKLAARLGMDRTTLTRNLSVLEKQGLVKISSGSDQRTRDVTITPKGRAYVAKAVPLWNEIQDKVREQMGESSWRELMKNLGQFLEATNQLNNQTCNK